MCLAVPALVMETDAGEALVDLHGNRMRVSTVLVPEVAVGDWVLLHAGFAIAKVEAEAAAATWTVLEDLQQRVEAANDEA
jgi:hydrogenase expression/formation protein HypC